MPSYIDRAYHGVHGHELPGNQNMAMDARSEKQVTYFCPFPFLYFPTHESLCPTSREIV